MLTGPPSAVARAGGTSEAQQAEGPLPVADSRGDADGQAAAGDDQAGDDDRVRDLLHLGDGPPGRGVDLAERDGSLLLVGEGDLQVGARSLEERGVAAGEG